MNKAMKMLFLLMAFFATAILTAKAQVMDAHAPDATMTSDRLDAGNIVDGLKYDLYSDKTATVADASKLPADATEVTIPASIAIGGETYTVTEIGVNAFMDKANLETVTIPSTVTCINNQAFWQCEKLSTVNFDREQIDYYGRLPFYGTPWIKNLIDNADGGPVMWKGHMVALKIDSEPAETLAIPEGTIGIGKDIELYGENKWRSRYVKNLLLPASLKWCGAGDTYVRLFDGLESIAVSPDNPYYFAAEGCLYQKDYTYANNKYYTGQWLVVCPRKYPKETLTVASGTIGIGDQTFYASENVKSVIVPEGVKGLGRNVFRYCEVEYVDLPSTVEDFMYSFCLVNHKMTVVLCAATPPITSPWDFSNCTGIDFYVPAASVEAYKAVAGFSQDHITVQSIDDIPTAINGINADMSTADAPTADAPMYNLAGQRVGKDYRGMVIQGGKKRLQR